LGGPSEQKVLAVLLLDARALVSAACVAFPSDWPGLVGRTAVLCLMWGDSEGAETICCLLPSVVLSDYKTSKQMYYRHNRSGRPTAGEAHGRGGVQPPPGKIAQGWR